MSRGPKSASVNRARGFAEDCHEVELVFDGAGTQWIPELEDEDNDYHELYRAVRENASARDFCSGVFGVVGVAIGKRLRTGTTDPDDFSCSDP